MKNAIPFNDIAACYESDDRPMKFDLFEHAAWRKKLPETADGDQTNVTLSSGKTVRVETKFLAFLRALADELASKEPVKH